MFLELDRCAECMATSSRPKALPQLPCIHCKPFEHARAFGEYVQERAHAGTERKEIVLVGMPMDRLQLEFTLMDEDGNLYKSRLPPKITTQQHLLDEERTREMMRLREENTQLLAENARLRRRLEK